jgi:hypothetical protein
MKSTFRPIEEGLAADAQAFDTEARREELAAAAGADVEQAAASSDAAAARDLARYGINPADGAFADTMAGGAVNKTAMKVGAMNNARTQARAEGRAFKFDVAGLGRNLPSAGATSTSLALNAGNAAVGNAGAPGANARSDAALFQNGLGSSVAATNSAGNLYSNIFDGQMRGYAADQSASASASAGFGNFASMAAYKMLPQLSFSSSKKLKKAHGDVDEKAAVRAIKKLGIQRWRYNKDASPDQAMHVGPYAEDFRKEMKIGDGKTISVIDAVGVTLAAVKGLAKSQDSLRRDVARLASHGLS